MTFDLKQAFRWLTLQDTSPELAKAQFGELQRQLPMLHVFLAVNVILIASTHYGLASLWLTIVVPAALVGCNIMRLYCWTMLPASVPNGDEAVVRMRHSAVIAIVFAVVYIGWALAVAGYGGVLSQALTAVCVAITVIGFVFSMTHLPQAVFGIATFVIVPYLGYYFVQGNTIIGAIALDILLVTFVMMRVLLDNFRAFNHLVFAKEEAERLNGEVTLLAHTDMLTGLPNRRLFFRELDGQIADCRATDRELALGIIDLDGFKAANDTYGHLIGDEILEMAGKRLRDVFGSHRMVARLGGDEFAFALALDGVAASKLGETACQALAEPYKLGDTVIHVGASCGIATTTDVASCARSLYDSADYALYHAKSHRRGFVTLYSTDHETRIRTERAIEAALKACDFDAEMDLHLQPIAETATGRVVTVEALARWSHPRLGAVRPDIFIPIAERAGLIHRLTLALIKKALGYLQQLPPNIQLSFNLSAHDLTCNATVIAIIALVRQSGIAPSRLLLELTETAAMRDFATAEQSINTLRAIGIRIALDDFGTGQSSLSYLHRLPIDKVKIDRSFLIGAGGQSGRDLLGAVVTLCHSLKMRCVAEGVEDSEQLQFLQNIGCDLYQGYHFARPMPIAELLAFLGRQPKLIRLAS